MIYKAWQLSPDERQELIDTYSFTREQSFSDLERHLEDNMNSKGLNLVTRSELAAQLGVSDRTIDNWVKEKLLPQPLRIKGRSYFDAEQVKDKLQGAK